MFTWICPKCGREVPPAYNECPDCDPKNPAARQPSDIPAEAAAAPVQTTPVVPAAPPQQPAAVQVHPYQPPPPPSARGGLPTWLLTILFAFAFFGLVAGVYWIVGAARGT